MLNLNFLLPLSDLEWPQCELLGLPPSVSSSSSWRVQTCCLWWQSSERGMPGLLRPDLLPSHFCQHQPSIKAHRERIPFFNLFFYIKSLWASDVAQWFKKKKKSACQCRRHGFYPWIGKMPWKRKWQPTEISLPGKSHGQRSLVIYSTWGLKKVRHDLTSKQQP